MKSILLLLLLLPFQLLAQDDEKVSPWVVEPSEMKSEYGAADEKGATNKLTPENLLKAIQLVKKGKTISLAIDLDRETPAYGWRRFELVVSQNEGTYHSNNEDVIFAPINTGTQIDGLAHMGVDGHFFNGFKGDDIQTVSGLKKLGIENAPPIVTKGIILDITAVRKTDRLKPGELITVNDVEAAMQLQKIQKIGDGDVVLFYTGHSLLLNNKDDKKEFLSGEPGPGIEVVEYLASKGVVAVGSDTPSLEVIPFEKEGILFPVHQLLLAKHGIHILENVATGRLVEKGWAEFLFIATPLPIVGSSSSWINPIAIN